MERAKARRRKLNETKVEIEKKLRLNDEGTQASNISFTPLSSDLGLLTEETQETEEIDISFADQNIAENEKSCHTEVKSFGEMCSQTDVFRHKFYDASSQTRTLIIYLRQIRKSSNLTKSISGIVRIKYCFTLVSHHMKF